MNMENTLLALGAFMVGAVLVGAVAQSLDNLGIGVRFGNEDHVQGQA